MWRGGRAYGNPSEWKKGEGSAMAGQYIGHTCTCQVVASARALLAEVLAITWQDGKRQDLTQYCSFR